jgi:NADPH-dependent ferric siderophore reductase
MTTTPPVTPTAPRGRPAPLRAEVRRIEQHSPRIRRVVLGGGELAAFEWPGAASHLKLILPLPGQKSPALPEPGPDGLVVWDRSQVVMRTYTPRAWDHDAGELTIDVFVHGEGPASVWASSAAPGDVVGVSRPRAHYDVDADAPWLVLAGDETAAPAIGTILESRPSPLPTTVVIESDGDDEDLGLGLAGHTPSLGEAVTFVRRSETPGAALLEALTDLVPEGDGRVWVAGEARGIRRIRAHLLDDRHLAASSVVTRGYWRQGEADHPDHDFGE